MLKDDIINWSGLVDNLDNELDTFIKDNTLPSVPPYEQIVNRKVLYEAYSNIIDISNHFAVLSENVIKLSVMKSQFKRLIRTSGYGPSMITSLNNIVEEIGERVVLLDKKLSVFKYSLDTQIRFYQSIQYILASPRLNTMD